MSRPALGLTRLSVSVRIGRSCPLVEVTRHEVGRSFPSSVWGQGWVKVCLYSPVMPSRRGQEQFLFDGICFYVRVLTSCVEGPLRCQARYGKAASLKLSVSLHDDYYYYYYYYYLFFCGSSKGFESSLCELHEVAFSRCKCSDLSLRGQVQDNLETRSVS